MGVELKYHKHSVKSQCFSQGFYQLDRIEKVAVSPLDILQQGAGPADRPALRPLRPLLLLTAVTHLGVKFVDITSPLREVEKL